MFTPQRLWSGRNNTPNKRGSGHDLGVISGEGSKGKGVENGGNLDREVLVERVSNLEKEVCFLFFLFLFLFFIIMFCFNVFVSCS